MAVLTACQSIRTTKSGIAETVFLFAFNTCFAIGWLGMTWLYPAEIVPLKIRAPANAVATTANWIWNFMVGLDHLLTTRFAANETFRSLWSLPLHSIPSATKPT